MVLFVRLAGASWTQVKSPPISLSLSLSLSPPLSVSLSPAASEPKAHCGSESRMGARSDTHTHTQIHAHTYTHARTHTHSHTHSVSLSLSRQVDGVVLARLQGSSLTPFEPMSQDNSRRFQSYCQRFPPSAFPRIPFSRAGSDWERHLQTN